MQIVTENQKTLWKTRVLSELWSFLQKGSKGVKRLLHPKIFCWKRKQHPTKIPSEKWAVQAVPSGLWRGTRLAICYCLALVCFGLLYLDIQKTNSALLRVCETQMHFNNMASPYENFTPAMYEYTVSKYCCSCVMCIISVNNM